MMANVIGIDEKAVKKLQTMTQEGSSSISDGLARDKTGSVIGTAQNLALILSHDPCLKDLIRYNDFTQTLDVTRDQDLLANPMLKPLHIEKGQQSDAVLNSILLYLAGTTYGASFSAQTAVSVIDAIARADHYNPLQDYLNAVADKWDRKSRLNTVLQIYLGAEKTKANVLAFKLWMMGAVAKAFKPNTKFDYVLDLVGGQGVGKTTFLAKLAPLGLYTDEFNTFTSRDDKSLLKGVLIANDDEMAASNRSSFEEIKKFVTDQVFEYRKAYGHYTERFHKGFVLARTSNEIQHLKDKSGDRRFLSIECSPEKQQKSPVDDMSQAYVDQLWGEAVASYRSKKDPFKLTSAQQAMLEQARQKFLVTSDTEDVVLDLIDSYKSLRVVTNQKLRDDLMLSLKHTPTKKELDTARYIMSHNGFLIGQRVYDPVDKTTKRGFKNLNYCPDKDSDIDTIAEKQSNKKNN